MTEYFVHVRDKWAVVWTELGWRPTLEGKYVRGEKPPRYTLPTTLDNADTACNWMNLSFCLMGKNPCQVCIERWEDQLIHDHPKLD